MAFNMDGDSKKSLKTAINEFYKFISSNGKEYQGVGRGWQSRPWPTVNLGKLGGNIQLGLPQRPRGALAYSKWTKKSFEELI